MSANPEPPDLTVFMSSVGGATLGLVSGLLILLAKLPIPYNEERRHAYLSCMLINCLKALFCTDSNGSLFFNFGSTISEIGTTLSIANTARLVLEEDSLHASMELTKKVLIFFSLVTNTNHTVWTPSTVFGLFALLHVLLSKKRGYSSTYFQASIFFMLLSRVYKVGWKIDGDREFSIVMSDFFFLMFNICSYSSIMN
tara:strand:- start:69 stop:662 length:594 start_codon:yes stop_codon:yes gene_type:complete